MRVQVVQRQCVNRRWYFVGEVFDLDCSYATLPRWCVEYKGAMSLGRPDKHHRQEHYARRPPPREPLKVEDDYVVNEPK